MTIYCGDAVQWANDYSGPLHHAMLCDPPYHLTSIVKRFGKEGSAPAQEGTDGAFRRASAGFMGQQWDGGDIAFRAETWAAFAKVLHPGAFGMAFASSRGFHRMAVAIEDAGFILHPFIAWAFGSGFPKATRIDTQIDREARAERETVAIGSDGSKRKPRAMSPGGATRTAVQTISEPATDLARAWSGHRYGLQAIKPAVEPILVFQKPYEGRPLDCITQTGAGALNVDAGRVRTADALSFGSREIGDGIKYNPISKERQTPGIQHDAGRWPANLIIGDEEAAEMIDRQSGTSASRTSGYDFARSVQDNPTDIITNIKSGVHFGDSGGASRFFFNVQTAIDCADPVIYRAKAGRTERDAGLERFDESPAWNGRESSGGNGETAATLPIRNHHPTIKPLSLTRYLASLLLPPTLYAPRRLFVPFAGVASEVCGADLAGWEEVSGVEMSADYCAIGEARRRFWSCNSGMFEAVCEQPEPEAQPSLFA